MAVPVKGIVGTVTAVVGGWQAHRTAGIASRQSRAGYIAAENEGKKGIRTLEQFNKDITRRDEPMVRARDMALDAMGSMLGLPSVYGKQTANAPREQDFSMRDDPRVQARISEALSRGERTQQAQVSSYSSNSPNSPLNRIRKHGGAIDSGLYTISEDGKTEVILDDEGKPVATVTGPSVVEAHQHGHVVPHPDNMNAKSAPFQRRSGGEIGPAGSITKDMIAQRRQAWKTRQAEVGRTPGRRTEENTGGMPGRYNFKTSPGYRFRLDEANRALERSAAARGGLLSGGFARKLARATQGYAADEYDRVLGRMAQYAGMNAQGADQLSNYQYGIANAINSAYQDQGGYIIGAHDAQAAGTLGEGKAWQDTMDNIAEAWGGGGFL